MCFFIDTKAERPPHTVGFKVVRKNGDHYSPLHFWDTKTFYKKGQFTYRNRGRTFEKEPGRRVLFAKHGIYVYLDFPTYVITRKESIIVVALDPKDFLYINRSGDVATYRKVLTIGEIA